MLVDQGWGVSAFSGSEDVTPPRFKSLKNKLITPGLVCMSGGNIYVFLTILNYWSVLCSSTSLVYVNNIVGAESTHIHTVRLLSCTVKVAMGSLQ